MFYFQLFLDWSTVIRPKIQTVVAKHYEFDCNKWKNVETQLYGSQFDNVYFILLKNHYFNYFDRCMLCHVLYGNWYRIHVRRVAGSRDSYTSPSVCLCQAPWQKKTIERRNVVPTLPISIFKKNVFFLFFQKKMTFSTNNTSLRLLYWF